MHFYHLYLIFEDKILVRQDFHAENDDIASGIAAIVADACSDRCDKLEVWNGTRIVMNDTSLRAREIIEKMRKAAEQTLATTEQSDQSPSSLQDELETSAAAIAESAMNANGHLRRSERLNARLHEIRIKRR